MTEHHYSESAMTRHTLQPGYAGWGYRVGSYLVDALVTFPGVIIYGMGMGMYLSTAETTYDAYGNPTTTGGDPTGVVLAVVGVVVVLGIHAWNRWFRAGRTGQSIGRKTFGITMIRATSGRPLGMGMAFLRDVCHVVDTMTCYLGWLWPLWDRRRQTLADKIVGSVVVHSPK